MQSPQDAARAAKDRLARLDRPMTEWTEADYDLKETLLMAELHYLASAYAVEAPDTYRRERQILDIVFQLGELNLKRESYILRQRED